MMYTRKALALMPYAQACVLVGEDGSATLISYETTVIYIDAEGWMTCTGTYSRTTIRHIGAFMKEYVEYPNGSWGTYFDAKAAYLGGYRFNIKTGEVGEL